ncbi:hypothetical protein Lal_00043662 [Lupinus albus]|nr:hypothetical protein Lal_00043662 [Lupinus albus]
MEEEAKPNLEEEEDGKRKPKVWEPRALPRRTTRWLDLKSSNILQDNEYNAKLSDYGLAKLAAMCLQEESAARPLMSDVVTALINANVSYFHMNMIDWTSYRLVSLCNVVEVTKSTAVWEPRALPRRTTRWLDLKSSNILRDNEYNAKLSDYGLAKLAAMCLQEESAARPLMSDVVTALINANSGNLGHCPGEQRDGCALPIPINEIEITKIKDHNIKTSMAMDLKSSNILQDNEYNAKLSDYGLAKLAAMCLQEESTARPLMSDVVTALINANSGNLGHCPGEQRDGCALPIPINEIEITTSNWIIISIIIFSEIPSILRPQPDYTKKN